MESFIKKQLYLNNGIVDYKIKVENITKLKQNNN